MRFRLLASVSSLTAVSVLVACADPGGAIDVARTPAAEDADTNEWESPAADGDDAGDAGSPSLVDAATDAPAPPPSPSCHEGDIAIYEASDAAALASTTCILGSLTLQSAAATGLPNLRSVSGSVTLAATASVVGFESLEIVGGELRVGSRGMSKLALPRLRGVDGAFSVTSSSVTSIDAPRLESVGGLEATYDDALVSFSLPRLKTIVGRAHVSSSGLTALSLPSLERVDGPFVVGGMTALADVALPRLREVGGKLGFVDVREPTKTIELPALERAQAVLVETSRSQLQTLSFPKLSSVGPFEVRSTSLTTVWLPALVECGAIKVATIDLPSFRAPELVRVAGTIFFERAHEPFRSQPSRLASIVLPKLTTAAAIRLVDLPELTVIDLARLKVVGEQLLLTKLPRVTQLWLPALEAVPDFLVTNLSTLTWISAPKLIGDSASYVSIWGDPMLAALDLSALTHLRQLEVAGSSRMTSLTLPAATSIGRLSVDEMPKLTWLSLPLLGTVSNLELNQVPVLETLDLPALTAVSALSVYDAPRLTSLGVLATVPTSLAQLTLARTGLATITFPSLVTASHLWLDGNGSLATLSLPALRHVSSGSAVRYSPALSACIVDEIDRQLLSGNIERRALAPCPSP